MQMSLWYRDVWRGHGEKKEGGRETNGLTHGCAVSTEILRRTHAGCNLNPSRK